MTRRPAICFFSISIHRHSRPIALQPLAMTGNAWGE